MRESIFHHGWKSDIACVRVLGSYYSMKLFSALFLGSALSSNLAVAKGLPAPAPVCQVARDAAKLIGKRVRVEGYIWDLSSHGLVLTDKRRDCDLGQLFLSTEHVRNSSTWKKAFANSLGPKRAILIGTVRWQKARFSGGRNPALNVERVEYVSRSEADPKEF